MNDMLRGFFSKHFGDSDSEISIPMEILAGAGGGCAQVSVALLAWCAKAIVFFVIFSLHICAFIQSILSRRF